MFRLIKVRFEDVQTNQANVCRCSNQSSKGLQVFKSIKQWFVDVQINQAKVRSVPSSIQQDPLTRTRMDSPVHWQTRPLIVPSALLQLWPEVWLDSKSNGVYSETSSQGQCRPMPWLYVISLFLLLFILLKTTTCLRPNVNQSRGQYDRSTYHHSLSFRARILSWTFMSDILDLIDIVLLCPTSLYDNQSIKQTSKDLKMFKSVKQRFIHVDV